jgi:pyrroloquinoline quinone biosynthesis protein E
VNAERPTTLVAELTHRCPLHCPYCSNPIELVQADRELSTADWQRVLTDARELGVLQLGLSGGEPLVRRDLEQIAAHAVAAGLYTTLVTSGVGLSRARAAALRETGLDHVQISFQDVDAATANTIAGVSVVQQKESAAAIVKELGFAFSINVVLHRANIDRLGEIIDFAARFGADRLELANTQYYGWALENRPALLPTRAQVEMAERLANEARTRYRKQMQIVYVLPDYYETYPKPCYGGWGKQYLLVMPDGRTLPCHGATHITSLNFPNVRESSLRWIWEESPAFQVYRGDSWMQEPCRSCDRRAVDFGGCRCQAFALTGNAASTDPVCALSPLRARVDEVLAGAVDPAPIAYLYRNLRTSAHRA